MDENYGSFILLKNAALAVVLVLAWFEPSLGGRVFGSIEQWSSRLAAHRARTVLGIAVLVIALRLSALPVVRIPAPQTHDEFSYLLAADTFAHGRLANPPHPMWIFLETFHVNQFPTYASKYPPGQGAVLALGQILGHPWIGVMLSVACMCAAITWALQGWVAPRWALVGGVLAATEFGVVNYWMESYWGGAVAAIGGSLVAGAYPRILRRRRALDAVLLGVGVGILANSRPYEGAVFTLIFLAALGWQLTRRRAIEWKKVFTRVVVPITGVLLLTGVFIGYYNWRVTGDPKLLPYVVNNRTYEATPAFLWQKPEPPREYRNAQMESFYGSTRTAWSHARFQWRWSWVKVAIWPKLFRLQGFYAPSQFLVPIVFALLLLLRSRKVFFNWVVCVLFVLALLPISWFFPHYAAPFTVTVYLLIVYGFRQLRQWTSKGRRVGLGWSRALVLFQILLVAAKIAAIGVVLHGAAHRKASWARTRVQMQADLGAIPGQHLVLVRYSPTHNPNQEWVYNHADIDKAKVVWAREIPGCDMQPLLDYFRGRDVWVVEPDAVSGPTLWPFAPPGNSNPASEVSNHLNGHAASP